MTDTVERRRVEVIVDAPLVNVVIAAANEAGIYHYTLLPTLGGEGERGRWQDDQVTRAQTKVVFLAVASEQVAHVFVERLSPMLDSHGFVLFTSSVSVVRGQKF